MKPNPVVWFEIYVQDMARAQRFYETVFQCTLQTLATPAGLDPGMQMRSFPGDMNTMGSGGMLVKMEGMSSGGGGTLVYFACDDCAVEQGRVQLAGGQVLK
ncbi:MAG: VOC family protein, partial [Proteobacteria bacterium]|nr:VOC family protein [Pseudomonadota bacterium]